jgi:hypothetical protein
MQNGMALEVSVAYNMSLEASSLTPGCLTDQRNTSCEMVVGSP